MFLSPSQVPRPGRRSLISLLPLLSILLLSASGTLISRQEPYAPPEDWVGKVVLAELFTGSECPPCLGADLAFDMLLTDYPSKAVNSVRKGVHSEDDEARVFYVGLTRAKKELHLIHPMSGKGYPIP